MTPSEEPLFRQKQSKEDESSNLTVSPRFGEYRDKVFRYYSEKRYQEALDIAKTAAEKFPDRDARTAFWIACLQSRLGEGSSAIATLESALARGVWWPEDTLRDVDLDLVRDKPGFESVQAECKRRKQTAPKLANPDLMIKVSEGHSSSRDSRALLVFHGRDGEHPEWWADTWASVLSSGVTLAMPWSSQVMSMDGRSWDDWDLAESDVKWAFLELLKKHGIDARKLLLGGFSQGAALAIYSTLKRIVPSRGFVAVAPSDWVEPEERRAIERKELSEPFATFVKASDCRGLRGVIIIGDQDPFFDKIKRLYALMVERGLDGKLIVEPGLGHDYPKEFDGKLDSAVDFILGTSVAADR